MRISSGPHLNTRRSALRPAGHGLDIPALFKQSVDHEIFNNHCLIHQQQLCAQKLNMKHLMTDIVKVVNFIRSRGLNHREFKAYLNEVGSEYEDVVYFS